MMLTDLDFVEDFALMSDGVLQAQELLIRVETECAKVGIHLNQKKTEYLTFNCQMNHIKTIGNV